MADSKISALPASTVPLAGTEVLPIVQSSTTRQVSVANLTAGRAISATQLTLTTGNLIVASGQGIDFSATSHPAGMTSELLTDYEEGTFTPSLTFGASSTGITYTSRSGTYTRVGRQITAYLTFNLSSKGSATGSAVVDGLPFTSSGNYYPCPVQFFYATVLTSPVHGAVIGSSVYLYYTNSAGDSNITDVNFDNTSLMFIVATYFV